MVDSVTIEKKKNGYIVSVAKYITTDEYVFGTLKEALQKAAYELDYNFKGEVKFPRDARIEDRYND